MKESSALELLQIQKKKPIKFNIIKLRPWFWKLGVMVFLLLTISVKLRNPTSNNISTTAMFAEFHAFSDFSLPTERNKTIRLTVRKFLFQWKWYVLLCNSIVEQDCWFLIGFTPVCSIWSDRQNIVTYLLFRIRWSGRQVSEVISANVNTHCKVCLILPLSTFVILNNNMHRDTLISAGIL